MPIQDDTNDRIAQLVNWAEREGVDTPDFLADHAAAERAAALAGVPTSTGDSAADICRRILRGN